MSDEIISEETKSDSSKPSGFGLNLGSIIIIVILFLGLVTAGYFIYNSIQQPTPGKLGNEPITTLIDHNEINPDQNTTPFNFDTNDDNQNIIITPIPNTPKPDLIITAENKSKKKGSKDPQLTVTYSGFKDGDNKSVLSGTLVITRAPGEKEGTYAITASGLTSTKYDINYVPGVFTIKSSSSSGDSPKPPSTEDPCDDLGQVTFSPTPGIYNTPQSVSLSYTHSNSSCITDIRYTLDNTEPTRSSNLYSSPINLSTTTAIKANVFSATGNYSGTSQIGLYVFNYGNNTVEPPTSSSPSGVVNYNSSVTLSSATPDANIYYTIGSNTTPSCSSTQHLSPILIDSNKTIKAIACKPGMTSSAISTFTYTIQTVLDANFSPQPQASNYNVSVSLSTNTINSSIYYNINNANNPSCSTGTNSQLYNNNNPIVIGSSNMKIKAIACKTGWKPSQVITKDYNVLTVATPTASPAGGTYTSAQSVTLSSETGATIYYTTNNNDPVCNTGTNGTSVTISSSTTLKARACKAGYVPSDVMTEEYVINSQPPEQTWLWAKRFGGSDMESIEDIFVDIQGNSYIVGSFYNITTFGTTTFVSVGSYDIFVAKLDNTGNLLWAKTAGGLNSDIGYAIVVGNDGSIYITGSFSSNPATFGSSSISSTNGSVDVFVAKMNSSGDWLWVKKAGNKFPDTGADLAVDSSNNIYVTGQFTNYITFEGLTFDGNYPNLLYSYGNSDVFVAKMDSTGNWLWAKKAGGTIIDNGKSIALDSQNNIYIAGSYSGNPSGIVTFGQFTFTSTHEINKLFIAKLDHLGNWLWVKNTTGLSSEYIVAIVIDNSNNIYATGGFRNFPESAGFGNIILTSSGDQDVFVSKLDSAGNWLWAKSAGGTNYDIGWGIATDNSDIYVTGEFRGIGTFGETNLTNQSTTTSDIFTGVLDSSNGNWISAEDFGNSGNDSGKGVAVDGSGNTYWAGNFLGNIVFGNTTLDSNSGSYDIFIAKKG